MLSPLERLIDQACGYAPSQAPPAPAPEAADLVTLRCPTCQRTTHAARDATDPADAVVVVCQCPECVGGDFDTPVYFRADGTETFYEEDHP